MITKKHWGKIDNRDIFLYKLTNDNGVEIEITDYGGITVSIKTPDRYGKTEDIILGLDNLKQYENDQFYLGAIIGRYANRIYKGKFNLDNVEYSLAVNNSPNHLHGGINGFNKVIWNKEKASENNPEELVISYLSKDMEEGYPGNLLVKVSYALNNRNEFKLQYKAIVDKPTILNLTNHCYFNLNALKDTVLNHELTIFADSVTTLNSVWVPTGNIDPVSNTCFDFTKPHKIGERIHNLEFGYNQSYVLHKKRGCLERAAKVFEEKSGRILEVFTTEPGLQLYTGDFLSGNPNSKRGMLIYKNSGLCLEAQHYPNSPNEPAFPSTVLRPGEEYMQITIYKFGSI